MYIENMCIENLRLCYILKGSIMQRFINNGYLSTVIRPQPAKLCAIVSIASIIKIITKKDVSIDDIMKKGHIKRHHVMAGKVGNSKMIDLANTFSIRLVIDLPDWNRMKYYIKSGVNPIIYHSKGHYCIIIGFIEEPLMLNSGDNIKVKKDHIQRWIVLADHRVKYRTSHERGMIELIKWHDIHTTINNNRNCALLIVQ